MLIPSERHTQRDLAHWDRLERMDLMLGARLAKSHKATAAMDAVVAFSERAPCYVATSWGKDSVVAVHLAALAGVRVPVVHIVQEGPQRDPDQWRVRDAFLARFPCDYHEIVVEPQRREQSDAGKAPALQIGIQRASEMFSPRWIGGLRADESSGREMGARRGSEGSCWPIKWWTAADVFAWLSHYDLPVHPSYACTFGGAFSRDKIRVSIIGGKKGTGRGRRMWEWAYFPEQMSELSRLGIVGPKGSDL